MPRFWIMKSLKVAQQPEITMNRLLLIAFVLVTSCYPKPTQSEPIGVVQPLTNEVIIEFVATGE
jgi:hypothetical protein